MLRETPVRTSSGWLTIASVMISFHVGCSTDLDFLVEGFLVVADFFEVEDFFGVDLALRDNLERVVEDFFWAGSTSGAGEARGDGSGEDIG